MGSDRFKAIDELGPDETWTDESRSEGIATVLAVAASIAALFMPWVVAGGLGSVGSKSALDIPVLNVLLILTMAISLVAVVLGLFGQTTSKIVTIAPLVAGLAISTVIIVVAEAMRSVLPTWATPIVTNSDVVTLRAGTGVWLYAGFTSVAVLLVFMPPGRLSTSSKLGWTPVVARAVCVVSVLTLLAVRAQPFYRFLARADLKDGQLPLGTQVGIQIGDIPFLGALSLMGAVAMAVAAGWIFIRPQPMAYILAGSGGMAYLLAVWLAEVVRRIASRVVPSGWSPFGETDSAAEFSLTPALGLSVFLALALLSAVIVCSWCDIRRDLPIAVPENSLPVRDVSERFVDDLP